MCNAFAASSSDLNSVKSKPYFEGGFEFFEYNTLLNYKPISTSCQSVIKNSEQSLLGIFNFLFNKMAFDLSRGGFLEFVVNEVNLSDMLE